MAASLSGIETLYVYTRETCERELLSEAAHTRGAYILDQETSISVEGSD